MKLKWSIMREPTKIAFQFFKYFEVKKFTGLVNAMYARYRSSVPPRTPSNASKFAQNEAEWNTTARGLCSPKKKTPFGKTYLSGAQRTEENPRQISLMYKENGNTVFGTEPPQNTPIHAVQYYVNIHITEHSRLNLFIRPECTGEPLRQKLLPLCIDSRAVIQQWKVMSPILGTEGPESAVIYLGAPLEDERVRHLINTLFVELHNDLVSLHRCPWGHVELKPGIYGFDLPDENLERDTLGQTHASSAGQIISAIVCKAAWEAAKNLYHGENAQAYQNTIQSEENEEEYLKGQLDLVLQELKWELED